MRCTPRSTLFPYTTLFRSSRMQHKIYWGPLKKPIEWSLKTVLAPWAYIASVIYHDSFWYPVKARRMIDRKSTRLNSSHGYISYAVFCLKKKKIITQILEII